MIKINFKKFGLYFFFLIVFSVVVYSINPGHPLNEIQGYFNGDTDLSMSIPKFQSAIGDCTGGQLMTVIKPDGTVVCDDLKPIWGAPSSITARGSSKGDMGGYVGMAAYCTGAGEHVCDAEELTAWMQTGRENITGWIHSGVRTDDGDKAYGDCAGWRVSDDLNYGNYWNSYRPGVSKCSISKNILCCKY